MFETLKAEAVEGEAATVEHLAEYEHTPAWVMLGEDGDVTTLPCFCCGKPLGSVFPPGYGDGNQPNEATTFRTGGHYGSGAFDPMDGSMLELNVCDDCLTGGAWRVLHLRTVQTMQTSSSPWVPA